jgi:hypothetical protein
MTNDNTSPHPMGNRYSWHRQHKLTAKLQVQLQPHMEFMHGVHGKPVAIAARDQLSRAIASLQGSGFSVLLQEICESIKLQKTPEVILVTSKM